MKDYQREFLDFAIASGVLGFGDFVLKSGRRSPYFFNSGLFDTGGRLARLGRFYAHAIMDSGVAFDMLYGPAYKGIPLVAATAIALAEDQGRDLPYCFNRKEAKKHAEGGIIVGAPLVGRVLIVDDVISAGISVGESVAIILTAGATPAGVCIALNRQEKALNSSLSAAQEVESAYDIPVHSVVTLQTLMTYLEEKHEARAHLEAIRDYYQRYGA